MLRESILGERGELGMLRSGRDDIKRTVGIVRCLDLELSISLDHTLDDTTAWLWS